MVWTTPTLNRFSGSRHVKLVSLFVGWIWSPIIILLFNVRLSDVQETGSLECIPENFTLEQGRLSISLDQVRSSSSSCFFSPKFQFTGCQCIVHSTKFGLNLVYDVCLVAFSWRKSQLNSQQYYKMYKPKRVDVSNFFIITINTTMNF